MARPSRKDMLSVAQLEQMLMRRRNEINRLMKKRGTLQRRLDNIDDTIRSLGGPSGGRGGPGRSRAKNDRSLVDVMAEVLDGGKPMRVSDIAEAVQGTGYRSTSDNFRSIVNQMLI